MTKVAYNVPENIPTIKKKLMLDPAFPFISSETNPGAIANAVEVTYPLEKEHNIILMHTMLPKSPAESQKVFSKATNSGNVKIKANLRNVSK
jgi:hypothetical protein